MKTISDFSIYCTEEQTRKAILLGAPIEYAIEGSTVVKGRSFIDSGEIAIIPTAEQLVGWLEVQGFYFYIFDDFHWTAEVIYGNNWYSHEEELDSRKEATMAAINAALEYLSINLNK